MNHDDRVKRVAEAMAIERAHNGRQYCDYCGQISLTDDEMAEAAISASDATLEVTPIVIDAINSVLMRYSGIQYNQYLSQELMDAALAAMRGEAK